MPSMLYDMQNSPIRKQESLTLFLARGAITAQMTENSFAISTDYGLGPSKFVNLILFRFELSQKSHFLKIKKKIFGSFEIKGSPSHKCYWKWFFFAKNITVSSWICIVNVQSFLLWYVILIILKLQILTHLCMKIFISSFALWQPLLPKL